MGSSKLSWSIGIGSSEVDECFSLGDELFRNQPTTVVVALPPVIRNAAPSEAKRSEARNICNEARRYQNE